MKAIIIKPGKFARIEDIDPTYSTLRTLVGGNIEMTYPFEDEYLAVISNEEAKLLDLPPNRAARRNDGSVADIYCGTMVVVALAPEGDYRDLTKRRQRQSCRCGVRRRIRTPGAAQNRTWLSASKA